MSDSSAARYELYYWPMLQGRGEFVRLALEEAGAPYGDGARLPEGEAGGVQALLSRLPEGRWIGGTIPYFMTEEGGVFCRERIFVTRLEHPVEQVSLNFG